MAILVMCSDKSCGELFEVPESAAGQEVRCPACGASQRIGGKPAAPAAASPKPSEPAEPVPLEEPDEDQPVFMPVDEEASGEDSADCQPAAATPIAPESPEQAVRQPVQNAEVDLTPSEEQAEDLTVSAEEDAFMPVHSRREVRSLYSHPPVQQEVAAGESFLIPEEPVGDGPPALGLFAEEIQDEEEKEENKLLVLAVLAVGAIGTLAGGLAGIGLGGEHAFLGALLGAGGGWVLGVLATFMLILAHPKDETPKVRCSTCGNVFPGGTVKCEWCGSDLPGPGVSPLTAGCLNSHHYATSNIKSVASLTALLGVSAMLLLGADRLSHDHPNAPEGLPYVLLGASMLLGFFVSACWLRYFLTVVGGTVMNHDRAPDAPKVWDVHNIAVGVKGLGAIGLYLVPVFTLPLLPLALLRLGAPRQQGAYDLVRNARAALAHARDFAALWLWHLLWLAVMGFAAAVIVLVFKLSEMIPPMEDPAAEKIIATLIDGARIAAMAAAAAVCGTAIFRCIGLFGKENARKLILHDDYEPPASDA